MASGLFTTDGVDLQSLYQEFMRDVTLINQGVNRWRDAFCGTPTTKQWARVSQQAMRFKKSGEVDLPDINKETWRQIDLPLPTKYTLGEGPTKDSIDLGLSSDEVRAMHQDALMANDRLDAELVLHAMLTDGGFWDANMTLAPPAYASNSFVASHDHYLPYNVGGDPILANFSDMKQHIVEHGYTPSICYINSTQAEKIEGKAPWNTTANYVSTPLIARLQEQGLWPEGMTSQAPLTAAGVPIVVNDWVPANYAIMVDPGATAYGKVCRMRIPEGPGAGNLQVETDNNFAQLVTYYKRWASVTVTARGAGVCAYFGGLNYVSPTFANI